MAGDEVALIVGAGKGLSASMARQCSANGMKIALASRNIDKLADLAKETDARVYTCDASQASDVAALFSDVAADLGAPDLVVYNPSGRVRGPVTEIDPAEVQKAIMITCFGGFLVGQQAAKQMVERGSGTILFTGASASVKGYPNSSAFAMGKFGLRGLAQAMARELHPQNVHIGHFIIDGGIGGADDPRATGRGEDALLAPDSIAETYFHVHQQKRNAWTWEIELRPWVEKF
jgi:NAD(P)-dependent dehydrogenase (short-subunit alcohol dehydrogenase family)